jgi:predicted amidohydrolase
VAGSVGLIERADAGLYVSQAAVTADAISCSRKCHLTEQEKPICIPGERLGLCDFGVAIVGTQICYDSAFPRASETLVRRGAELLITPTGHGEPDPGDDARRAASMAKRRLHVQTYWRARAYDYSTYSLYVNCSGTDSSGDWFPGYAALFGPDGETVAESVELPPTMLVADLRADHLAACRANWVGHYRALDDARPELYD